MGHKTLELTIISAKDLKNVNLIGKMDVYVVVSLSDEPKTKQKTPVHQDGGTNPSWNYTMRFTVDDQTAANPSKFLIFLLKHEYSLGADKDLGEVRVSIKELLDSFTGKDPNSSQFLTYQVRRASGKAKGELKFSYKFVDMGHNKPSESCPGSSSMGYAAPPPMAAYPPPEMAAQSYPPPPAGYPGGPNNMYPPPPVGVPYAGAPSGHPPYSGYPPPPGAYPPPPGGYGYGYGYPPQGPGGYPAYPQTGYPPAQQPQKPNKGNKFGMGLGAGLIGGALGGLVLGEMVDDAFDDCGGFD